MTELSDDEYDVLLAAAEGEEPPETAERTGCAVVTIWRRRQRVQRKLNASTMAAAVSNAYRRRILVVPETR